jgi:hypothetical protein
MPSTSTTPSRDPALGAAEALAIHAPELRQVVVPAGKAIRRKNKGRSFPGGIVAEPGAVDPLQVPSAADALQVPSAADLLFPPIIPGPISASNGGGAIGTGLPVQLIFWGSAWNQASTNPSAGVILSDVQTILRSPWISGLRQYGIRRCTFGGAIVVTSPTPPPTYNDSDVQDLIWVLIDDNRFPEPDDPGGRNLYVVFMPPGSTYGPGGIRGKHLVASDYDFPADIDHAWVGFIVTNTLNPLLSTFCHELAEMCTDPESDAWTVTGNQEIGDVCNAVDGSLSGVNVESYWSVFDNACLIPTAWSLRRTLAGAGIRLSGQGLRSFFGPIPSLNQFIVNL